MKRTLLFSLCLAAILCSAYYFSSINSKLKTSIRQESKCVDAWGNCLNQLNINRNIVFIGGSHCQRANFAKYYHRDDICNLGYRGSGVDCLIKRLYQINYLSPKQVIVFLSLNNTEKNIDNLRNSYACVIDSLKSYRIDNICFVSYLPYAKYYKSKFDNSFIQSFNNAIKEICDKSNVSFIDIYSLYAKDGFLQDEYTEDGIHLKSEYYKIALDEIRHYLITL